MDAPVFLESAADPRLMPFWDYKNLTTRINKVAKVNIQADHIVRVLIGFTPAAVPHDIVASFRNAGIFLLLDTDRVIRCVITPETAGCLLGTPFSGALTIPEEEEDEEDLDIREYVDQVEQRLIGFERGEGDGGSDTVSVAVTNQGK
jgi:hypothetical protein